MVSKKYPKNKIFLLTILLILILDQASKAIVKRFVTSPIFVIPKVFSINYVRNTGAGFSLFGNIPNSNMYLTFLTMIIIGIILINYDKIERPVFPFISLIVAGALGNLIDRIRWGFVVDFLDFQIWPVFNVADSAITIGGFLVLFYLLRNKE